MPGTTTAARPRLRLSPAALAAAVLLLPGPFEQDRLGEAMSREVAELEVSGVARHGVLAPWAADQLMLLLAPQVHVEAVVATSAGTSLTQVWAHPDAAVIGRIDPRGWLELIATEPSSLGQALRSIVGLAARAEPPVASQPSVDPARLARFEEALAIGDHPAASDLLADGASHGGAELSIMAALASTDRRTWRITACWSSAAGPEQRWLSALDAGSAGLWCAHGATVRRADTPDRAAPLVAVSVAEAWNLLRAVLPPDRPSAPTDSAERRLQHHGRPSCPTPVPPSPTTSSDSRPPPEISLSA